MTSTSRGPSKMDARLKSVEAGALEEKTADERVSRVGKIIQISLIVLGVIVVASMLWFWFGKGCAKDDTSILCGLGKLTNDFGKALNWLAGNMWALLFFIPGVSATILSFLRASGSKATELMKIGLRKLKEQKAKEAEAKRAEAEELEQQGGSAEEIQEATEAADDAQDESDAAADAIEGNPVE